MAPIVAPLILFTALLLVAAAATGAAWTSPGELRLASSAERLPAAAAEPVQAVPVAISCPQEDRALQVVLGIDPRLGTPGFTVLTCEHFGTGEVTCDMACLGAPVPA